MKHHPTQLQNFLFTFIRSFFPWIFSLKISSQLPYYLKVNSRQNVTRDRVSRDFHRENINVDRVMSVCVCMCVCRCVWVCVCVCVCVRVCGHLVVSSRQHVTGCRAISTERTSTLTEGIVCERVSVYVYVYVCVCVFVRVCGHLKVSSRQNVTRDRVSCNLLPPNRPQMRHSCIHELSFMRTHYMYICVHWITYVCIELHISALNYIYLCNTLQHTAAYCSTR